MISIVSIIVRVGNRVNSGLTRIRLQLAIYFSLHRWKFAGKHGKLARRFSLPVTAHILCEWAETRSGQQLYLRKPITNSLEVFYALAFMRSTKSKRRLRHGHARRGHKT